MFVYETTAGFKKTRPGAKKKREINGMGELTTHPNVLPFSALFRTFGVREMQIDSGTPRTTPENVSPPACPVKTKHNRAPLESVKNRLKLLHSEQPQPLRTCVHPCTALCGNNFAMSRRGTNSVCQGRIKGDGTKCRKCERMGCGDALTGISLPSSLHLLHGNRTQNNQHILLTNGTPRLPKQVTQNLATKVR